MEPPPAVSFYEISVTVHVIAVVIGFGPTFAYGVIQSTAERAYPRHLPFALRAIKRIDKGIAVPGVALVGVTGIYQAIDGPYEMGRDQWLDIGLLLYLVVFAGALFILRASSVERSIAAAERMIDAAGPDGDVALSDEYRRVTKVPKVLGAILAAAVLVIIYLMQVKPFTG